MPDDITIYERSISRAGTDDAVDIIYLAIGSDDSASVRSSVIAQAWADFPDGYDGLQFGGMSSIRVIDEDDQKWECTIRYGIANWAGAGAIGNATLMSFSTVGGTEHIYQSKETRAKFPDDAPDYQGAINVANGHPGGVEIIAPILNFTIRQKYMFPASTGSPGDNEVSQTLIDAFRLCTGHYNDDDFSMRLSTRYDYDLDLTFLAGELLLRGVDSPEQDDNGNIVATFHFSAGLNRTADSALGPIPLDFMASSETIDKAAWDYIWFAYRNVKDDSAQATVPRPSAVYVERVYDPADFTILGIAAPP